MNTHPTDHPEFTPRQRRRRLLQRMDETIARRNREDSTEMMRRLRETYFADVDALQKSGTVQLPK